MKTVAEVIGVSRANLSERLRERPQPPVGRPPLPDDELVAQIEAVIAELPTYGYRRVHAILKRQALAAGLKPANHKRVYRVMKVHGLLLDRHAGGVERRHDGRIAVDERNRRWCSDGFEIGCDNGERVRVAFALDCCDREAMSFLATTAGISSNDVRDLMVAALTVSGRSGLQQAIDDPRRGEAGKIGLSWSLSVVATNRLQCLGCNPCSRIRWRIFLELTIIPRWRGSAPTRR